MAVTPWSWTSSNGTASAAQTKAAYAALTSSGNTAAFHRYVWNDLVSKVNEVVTALNLSWADTYGSFVDTRMNSPYEELTAARFNSVRLNARYPAWTWKYDTTTPGYIGRTDFKGVAEVGGTQADIVYGYYIIELTERLNKIIGILNGTEPYYDLISNSRSTLAPVPNLIILPGEITYVDKRIIQSANAEVKNISPSSLLNNFYINGPITRAVMESEQFSNYFARVEMNLLFTRAIKLLPSVLFRYLT